MPTIMPFKKTLSSPLKVDLQRLAGQFGLDDSGSVNDLRKRLKSYLDDNAETLASNPTYSRLYSTSDRVRLQISNSRAPAGPRDDSISGNPPSWHGIQNPGSDRSLAHEPSEIGSVGSVVRPSEGPDTAGLLGLLGIDRHGMSLPSLLHHSSVPNPSSLYYNIFRASYMAISFFRETDLKKFLLYFFRLMCGVSLLWREDFNESLLTFPASCTVPCH